MIDSATGTEVRLDPEERRRTLEAIAAMPYTPPDPETRRQIREYTRQLARESNSASLPEFQVSPEELETLLDEIDAIFDRLETERAAVEPSLSIHPGTLSNVHNDL